MPDEIDRVLDTVATAVDPDEDERTALWSAVDSLTTEATAVLNELGIEAEVIHVGSSARGTWLSGERDIDLFVRFPTGTDREMLRRDGLRVGRALLEDGEANYAEHPYISGTYDGFDVDVVPCVAVDDASEAETAVDRTPFHAAYIDANLDEALATEVRIAKQFCTAIGVYGSNLKTRGFGGYLLELLVLEYGGVRTLFEALADWRPPVRLDPAEESTATFDDPLVVIDPTDPQRNVAAVVYEANIASLQHYTRAFLADPDSSMFEPHGPASLSAERLRVELKARNTGVILLQFDRPELVDDQLFPQVRKTRLAVQDALDRRGFDVLRSTRLEAEDGLGILFECAVTHRPTVERHLGPPVHMREHAEHFVDTYRDRDVYGPYIEGDRYVVERDREFTHARAFLESDSLFDVALGEQLRDVLTSGYTVLVDDEILEVLPRFEADLATHFDPRP